MKSFLKFRKIIRKLAASRAVRIGFLPVGIIATVAAALSPHPLAALFVLSVFADSHVVWTITIHTAKVLDSKAWHKMYASQFCSLILDVTAVYLVLWPPDLGDRALAVIGGGWLLLFTLKRLIYAWGFQQFAYDLRAVLESDEYKSPLPAIPPTVPLPPDRMPVVALSKDCDVGDVTIRSNIRGAIIDVNRRAEELFGYGPGELIGQQVEVLIPEAYRDRHHERFKAVVAGEPSKIAGQMVKVAGLKKDGSVFPIALLLLIGERDGERIFTVYVHELVE